MSLVDDVYRMPFTLMAIVAMSCWYLYTWNYHFDIGKVTISYDSVVTQKQYYRVFTAAVSHLCLMHIAFNMSSLYSIGSVEFYIGTLAYIRYTFMILVVSSCAMLGIYYLRARRLGRPEPLSISAAGYSGVLFGWMAYIATLDPFAPESIFGMVDVPAIASPFFSLVLIQIIVPRASFVVCIHNRVLFARVILLASWRVLCLGAASSSGSLTTSLYALSFGPLLCLCTVLNGTLLSACPV